jgi:hypothetical protein
MKFKKINSTIKYLDLVMPGALRKGITVLGSNHTHVNSNFTIFWILVPMNLHFTVRPYLNKLQLRRILPALRRFMIPPLLRAIEIDEAMEFLTEMRQVREDKANDPRYL